MIDIKVKKDLNFANGKMTLDIDLKIESGLLTTLFGKSGAGKTSLLNILSGLMTADEGHIRVDDRTWFDKKNKINLSPQKRKIGFVFQDYALFPNMTVENNLTFALQKGDDRKIISELIELMELGDLRNEKPNLLSGGQRQRVALARALVQRPRLLMLDEPFSAQDRELRNKLQTHILKVHKQYHLTTILVSHDVNEIIKVSDNVLVLDHGKLIDRGKPNEILPIFSTANNLKIQGKVIDILKGHNDWSIIVEYKGQQIRLPISEEQVSKYQPGQEVTIYSELLNPKIN
jgi:molybdate transport system ATP-binding protein